MPYSISRVAKLRYCQQATLNTNSSNNSSAVYYASGCFTPASSYGAAVTTTTSHQPKGWDEWSAFYNDYAVLRSKITVRPVPNNSTSPLTSAGFIAITLSDNGSAFSVGTSAIEDGKTNFQFFGVNTSSNPITVSHRYDAKKFFNVVDVADNLSRIGAATTTNPTENAYFMVHYFTSDPTSASSTGPLCWIYIDYEILFTSPKNLAQS
jgi:hypothetical protein